MNDIARRKRERRMSSSCESKDSQDATASSVSTGAKYEPQCGSLQQHVPLDHPTTSPTRARNDLLGQRGAAVAHFDLSSDHSTIERRSNFSEQDEADPSSPRHHSQLDEEVEVPEARTNEDDNFDTVLHPDDNDEEQVRHELPPLKATASQSLVQEGLFHRAVHFVWEAEADYHSSSAKKKKKKKKKKNVAIKDNHFEWDQTSGKCKDEIAILDMKVTARGNNISGGFAQVLLPCTFLMWTRPSNS